jgi:hypothetical protein
LQRLLLALKVRKDRRLYKRMLCWVVLLVSVVDAAVVVRLLFLPEHRISPETYKMIQEGMTEAEVERLLGVPPGNYSFPRMHSFVNGPGLHASSNKYVEWTANCGQIRACFDHAGKVRWARFHSVNDWPEHWFNTLRRWLRL